MLAGICIVMASSSSRRLSELLAQVDAPGPGYAELSFFDASMTVTNLGGMCGLKAVPSLCANYESRELRYANLGINNEGFSVDLRITNTSEYVEWNAGNTGCGDTDNTGCGDFGMINIRSNEPVGLEFCFVKGGTDELQDMGEYRVSRSAGSNPRIGRDALLFRLL